MRAKCSIGLKLLKIVIAVLILSYYTVDTKISTAAVYLDGSSSGCSSGSTIYDPATRSCGSGTDTVYTTLASFSANIVPGATNYMRAGSYFRDTGNANIGSLHISSSKSGTSGNPTIIKAYPGEERQVIIGTAKRGATYNSNPSDSTGAGSWLYYPNRSLMTYDAQYVTIDGVKTYGQVYLAGGHDVILQNSDCGGGGAGTSQDQGNTIRFNNIYNVTLKNNKIHHNCRRYEDNTGSLIIGYVFSALLDQNTFIDGYGSYFEDKDGTGQTGRTTEVRYNFFGPSTISSIDTVGVRGFNQNQETSYQYIHHNILYNKTIGINVIGSPVIDNIIYNNTFINCGTDIKQPSSSTSGSSFKNFNNLFYHSSTGHTFAYVYYLSQLAGSDWNVYYDTGNWVDYGNSTQSSLAGWKSYSGKDPSSISSNPNFANANGTTPADFKRTSYAENFTGSPYGTHAGAYETGNEVIGFTPTGASSIVLAPTNLRIVSTN